MKRIAIVEDHTAVREMLVEMLRTTGGYEIVAESGDGLEAAEVLPRVKPDLLVLDVRLPGLNGVDLLRRISRQLPNLRVLVFSGYENAGLVRDMLEAGAHGFVEKTAGLSEFRKGLEAVALGGSYFGPSIAAILRTVVSNPGSTGSGRDPLTPREREILQLIAESYSTKEIASKLSLSVKTVDNHRTNLMRKLDLHNVASLTRYAIENGLVASQRAG
jgi:DNA-binding NarL/FixJ family response regulator